MTTAPPKLLEARKLLLKHLPLQPLSVGIAGDTAHVREGDSYHLGLPQQDRNGSYSVRESSRDRAGLSEYASAMDIGQFTVKTSKGTFTLISFNHWLVGLCKANDPDTADIREIIYTPDGKTVRRWDRLGRRTGGDSSHLSHTHISEFRDARGRRMVQLVKRWLQHIGLIATRTSQPAADEEDDMPYAITGQLEQGKAIVLVVPPVQGGGAKWGRAWLALGSDFLDATVRVMVHNGTTWGPFYGGSPTTTVARGAAAAGKELPKGCTKVSLRWEANPNPTALAAVGYRIEYAPAG